MKTKTFFIVHCSLFVLLFAACSQTAPQRPSQRKSEAPKPDSTQMALLALNQQLTEAADAQLAQIARSEELPFALYEHGTWAAIIAQGDGETVQAKEECTLHIRTFSLSGQLYTDSEQSARIGAQTLPAAIEENITEWRHGAQIVLLAPWYAAYGIQGTEHIPPYENIRIELTIQ